MKFFSYFLPTAPIQLVYMLQQVEYSSKNLIFWLNKLPDLSKVQKRHKLTITSRIRLTLAVVYLAWVMWLILVVFLAVGQTLLLLTLLILSPIIIIGSLVFCNTSIGVLIVRPFELKELKKAQIKLDSVKSTKIAILGSYGKTTLKEILATVLATGVDVAATADNKNVLISHARWVNEHVTGKEDVLIFEFGEAKPGDIEKMALFTKPDLAIITGLAPAHLDAYESLDAVAKDLATIFNYVGANKVFINTDSSELVQRLTDGQSYSEDCVGEWQTKLIKEDLHGMMFTMHKQKNTLKLNTKLVGRHLLAPLSLAVAIADTIGLKDELITKGVASTKPFKHRMRPYRIGDAWIIDDTYNGNFEGMVAGLALLSRLTGKRKIYVTPGLVEQGDLKESVHIELGKTIAESFPDIVVLMQNSATTYITDGLTQASFRGELKIETHPLEFYSNLDYIVVAGDIVLMQNDWSDSYL